MNEMSDQILFFTDVADPVKLDELKRTLDEEECPFAKFVFGKPGDNEIDNVLIYIENPVQVCANMRESTDSPLKCLFSDKEIYILGCANSNVDGISEGCRILLLLKPPLDSTCLEALQKWAIEGKKCTDLHIDFLLQPPFNAAYVNGRIVRHCIGWRKPQVQQIQPIEGFRVGGMIKVSEGQSSGTVSPITFLGKMGSFSLQLRELSQRFKQAKKKMAGFNFKEFPKQVKLWLESLTDEYTENNGNSGKDNELPDWVFKAHGNLIPRVLLLGESGVGKTMLCKYLNELVEGSSSSSFARISIPEYLGKEEELEAAFFGYAPGNHTGALRKGSTGTLVENVGRVVFLDEIGEASPIIQAKLLTYMDDYFVRPLSWTQKKSFYCPTLIVAATNKDLYKMAKEGTFRHDLLARFTDVLTIPPLRERTEIIDFCVDMLLQQEAINPGGWKDGGDGVNEIGPDARMKLRYHDYRQGNFRELSEMLTRACQTARRDHRRYLNAHDIEVW